MRPLVRGALASLTEGQIPCNTIQACNVLLSEFEYHFPPSNRPASAAETGVLPALEHSDNEQKVYDSLSNEEISIDDVIRKSGLPSSAVSVGLLSLEMKRVIRQLPGKLFVKNN